MPVAQAIVLGVVQGLAEFLPISSSAHLILVPWLFGWEDPGLAFDVALHWGTLIAVLVVFWRERIRLIFGAGVLEFPQMVREMRAGTSAVGVPALLAGLAASAIVGVLVIRWLLAWLRTRTYDVFVAYRLLVAVLIVVVWLAGKR